MKVSIRFYKDYKVRAVWDEEHNQWWFSVLDIVGSVNGQDDHEKNRNYWKYLKAIFMKQLKMCVDWSKINKKDYLEAMIASHTDSTRIRELLKQAMTDRIDDCEIFMKGIDYSYFYEQEDGHEVVEERKEDKV